MRRGDVEPMQMAAEPAYGLLNLDRIYEYHSDVSQSELRQPASAPVSQRREVLGRARVLAFGHSLGRVSPVARTAVQLRLLS